MSMPNATAPSITRNVRQAIDTPGESVDPHSRENKSARLEDSTSAHVSPVITSPSIRRIPSRSNRTAPPSPLAGKGNPPRNLEDGEMSPDLDHDTPHLLDRDESPDPFRDTGRQGTDVSMEDDRLHWTPKSLVETRQTFRRGTGTDLGDPRGYNAAGLNTIRTSGRIAPRAQSNPPPPSFFLQPGFEFEKTKTPTSRDHNPHGPMPVLQPVEPDIQYMLDDATLNDGNFHRALFYPSDIVKGLLPTQLEAIEANPDVWVAISYFNGGETMHAILQDTTLRMKEWMQRADITYSSILTPFYPQPTQMGASSHGTKGNRGGRNTRNGPGTRGSHGTRGGRGGPGGSVNRENTKTSYEGLNTAFLKVNNRETVRLLTEWQTFAIDNLLTFHASPLLGEERPWVVCLIYSNEEGEDEETEKKILYTIKQGLWSDNRFIGLLAGKSAAPGSTMDKVLAFTNSLDLASNGYMIKKQGHNPWVWTLFAPPFATRGNLDMPTSRRQAIMDKAEKTVRSYISTKQYAWGETMVWGEQVECALCKITTHHTFQCPFPNVAGWQGPKEGLFNEIREARKRRSARNEFT
ncbi:hypothetical protein C8R41DRAFT_832364 [Lentinula lateritia]|uniref:Uncharacterized protein n=1 Tax=Lentinula lateritia TaxID=40482 RepID=A0ABQ8VFI6_9AGAR|nr:hypothetical protein C8R41DRAFT_832364 [Lentinula lateritia]